MAKAEPPKGVALERSPSHLLHRALQHALDIYVGEAGPSAPTQRQFAVLSAVSLNEGLSQTDLVRATGIDRSTLADLVARMIGKGLLARERSATDGRANTVRLTAAGRAALRQAEPNVAAADEKILSLVPARARDSFLSVLLTMSEAAERETEPQIDGADATGAAPAGKKKKVKAAKPAKPAKAPERAKAAKSARVAAKTPKAAKAPAPAKSDKKKKKKPKK
jgi:DNA-binding MarR family transcriptional regulator